MHSKRNRVAAILLGCSCAMAASGNASSQDMAGKQLAAEPVRTAKERLSGKSADEQRVDNCKVPLESRGPAAPGSMREPAKNRLEGLSGGNRTIAQGFLRDKA
jgi:hypothetical protein